MENNIHILKTKSNSFQDVAKSLKTAIITEYSENYMIGDYILLEEIDINNKKTGNSLCFEISSITNDEGLKQGHCLLSFGFVTLKATVLVKDLRKERYGTFKISDYENLMLEDSYGWIKVHWNGLKNKMGTYKSDLEFISIKYEIPNHYIINN